MTRFKLFPHLIREFFSLSPVLYFYESADLYKSPRERERELLVNGRNRLAKFINSFPLIELYDARDERSGEKRQSRFTCTFMARRRTRPRIIGEHEEDLSSRGGGTCGTLRRVLEELGVKLRIRAASSSLASNVPKVLRVAEAESISR